MATVTVIKPTINQATLKPLSSVNKRRVAAYARVSTDKDEQLTSYDAQIDYYTKMIKANPKWEYVDVYTDEGISGTSIKNRDGFNRMIEDALNGKIDLIVTKSVSRFARNTVDSLTTIRKLKDKGVECYFEKENIYSLDSKGELLLTIMSSLAQEESRSISENVKWGHRKRFSDGKVNMSYGSFLGYKKGEDGKPEVVEEEAAIVREIYFLYLKGMSCKAICEELETKGYKTPRGKTKWAVSTIQSILTNEKYKGDALLQKTYTVDFLTHKTKKNEGEIQKYYVKESHPCIVDPIEWELVQMESKRRKELDAKYSGKSILSSKIFCGECGELYGSKVWHSNTEWRKEIWQCNGKFKKSHHCSTPSITEVEIKNLFIKAYNNLIENKHSLLEDIDMIIESLIDDSELDKKATKLEEDLTIISDAARALINENSTKEQDQDDYQKKYAKYQTKYENILNDLNNVRELIKDKENRIDKIKTFKTQLADGSAMLEWDDRIWITTLDKAIVKSNKTIEFRFYSGESIITKI